MRTLASRPGIVGVFVAGLVIGVVLATTASVQTVAQDHGAAHGKPQVRSTHWAPVENMHLYLCAFHIAKDNPRFQVEAHHFCSPRSNLHQCVIYDSQGPNARLLGVEYLISDDVYRGLPDDEKKYWHPHAYEIISGQLVAPDLPKEGDDLFAGLITTWGKTWHTWRDPTSELPLGEPMLMWSANGDGQIDTGLLSQRDVKFGISTDAIRERRKAYGYEVPQIQPPRSLAEIGRQWTATGPDQPTKK